MLRLERFGLGLARGVQHGVVDREAWARSDASYQRVVVARS